MSLKKYSEQIFGIIMIAIALVYFILTQQVPKKTMGVVNARFIPNVVSGIMFILGVLQSIEGYKKAKEFKEEVNTKEEQKIDYSTVIKTVVCILLYVAFIKSIGFLIVTAVFLFAEFVILTPTDKKKNYVLYGVIAIIAAVGIYYSFRNVLNVMLPPGILK